VKTVVHGNDQLNTFAWGDAGREVRLEDEEKVSSWGDKESRLSRDGYA